MSDAVRVAVMKVEFEQIANCSGFDETQSPRWLMVPFGSPGSNTANAVVDPSGSAGDVEFDSTNVAIATAAPQTAITSPQLVTITGASAGHADIEAEHGSSAAFGTMSVDVKNRLTKRVLVHAVAEDNDDMQIIPIGQGMPNQICITAGANGVLNSTQGGDDGLTADGLGIHSGPDGICNSTRSGDDIEVIRRNRGFPRSVCVAAGPNGFRDTIRPAGDDHVTPDDRDIQSGTNGICQTRANNVNVRPLDVPGAASLEDYLNNTAWGRQANVHFSVTRRDSAVNYDLDRNGMLADPVTGSATSIEINSISSSLKDISFDYNVYFVESVEHPVALAINARGEAWVGDLKSGSALYVAAHEIGHLLGQRAHSNSVQDLMYHGDLTSSPCRILQVDWQSVNP